MLKRTTIHLLASLGPDEQIEAGLLKSLQSHQKCFAAVLEDCEGSPAIHLTFEGSKQKAKDRLLSRRRYNQVLLGIRTRTHSVTSRGSQPPYWLGDSEDTSSRGSVRDRTGDLSRVKRT
ncbi:hypothetical protein TNCV_2754561 [Trichonephila clavipes]|nr:hypothetical protein TNCV_2754561 [Trichonephila clavipes]